MIYLLIVSLVWAFSFSLIKGTLGGLDSNFVALTRMLLSLLVFLPFLRLAGIAPGDRLKLAGIGAVQFGLMYVAYIAAFASLPAHMIALLTTTTPIFVTLFHDGWERRLHVVYLLAALLAVGAGVVVKYPDQAFSISLKGVLLVQLSNLAFALGQVAYKKLAAAHPEWRDQDIFGLLYAGAVLVTAAFALVTVDFTTLRVSPVQMAALGYLGIVASGVCFFLWNLGAKTVNSGTLATLNNLKIPLGILAALLLLREHTDYPRLLAGIALMGLATWLCERRPVPAAGR